MWLIEGVHGSGKKVFITRKLSTEEIGCHDGGLCTEVKYEVTEFLIDIEMEDCARTNNFSARQHCNTDGGKN